METSPIQASNDWVRTLLLLGVLTVWVALPGVAAAYLSVGEPAPFFSVESGDDENLTLDMLRGKVIILFYETREVVDKNREFKDYLKSLYNGLPEAVQENVFRLVVINCLDASFATRPIWRMKLREASERQGMTIYGDWTGDMLRDYQMQDDESNFLVIDKNGIIRYMATGLIERSQFEKLKEMLLNLANNK
ncbi:MAG: redoxin domain-containing protein [Desulfobaccales bacterium]